MVPLHSHIEIFLPNHKGSESSSWTCSTSRRSWVRQFGFGKKFKYPSQTLVMMYLKESRSQALLEHHLEDLACHFFPALPVHEQWSSEDLTCLVLGVAACRWV